MNIDWRKEFDFHISDMKYREQEQRKLMDNARLKAEVIMDERMKIEHFIYKIEERNKQ